MTTVKVERWHDTENMTLNMDSHRFITQVTLYPLPHDYIDHDGNTVLEEPASIQLSRNTYIYINSPNEYNKTRTSRAIARMSPGSVHNFDQLFIHTTINIWGFPNVVSPLSQHIPGKVCKDGVPREADASGGLDENWPLNETEECTFNELHTNAEVEDTKDLVDINDTALTSVKFVAMSIRRHPMLTAKCRLAKNLGAVHELNGRSDTGAFRIDAYDMFHADKTLAFFRQRLSISHLTGYIESTADMETPESILGAY